MQSFLLCCAIACTARHANAVARCSCPYLTCPPGGSNFHVIVVVVVIVVVAVPVVVVAVVVVVLVVV
jgi:hypothetical protein